MKIYYAKTKPATRLSKLTPEMIKLDKMAPRFRAKAAETRYLIQFAAELATAMYESTPRSSACKTMADMMGHLLSYYKTLGVNPFDRDLAKKSAKAFCLLFNHMNLITGHEMRWKLKPKFHLFLELTEFNAEDIGDPSLFWCYQDEGFVGWVATLALARGGGRRAATTPTNVVERYRALVS